MLPYPGYRVTVHQHCLNQFVLRLAFRLVYNIRSQRRPISSHNMRAYNLKYNNNNNNSYIINCTQVYWSTRPSEISFYSIIMENRSVHFVRSITTRRVWVIVNYIIVLNIGANNL